MEYFESIDKNDDVIAKLMKYTLLSKVYDTKLLDTGGELNSLRISLFYSNISSTGKGQAMKAFEQAVNKINKRKREGGWGKEIRFDKSVDVNDASLVGTKKKVNKEFVPVLGKFNNYDIMFFPECSTLFTKSEYKTTMIQILQSAMDYPGFVSKSLADTEIKYNTDAALIMTSVPFKAMSSYLLETGFFQRFLICIGDKDYIDIDETSNEICDEIFSNNDYTFKEKELNVFIDKLEESWRQQPAGHIIFADGCKEKMKIFINAFIKKRDTFSDKDIKNIFSTFQPRSIKLLFRMASLNSLFNLHRKVLPEDFDEPLELMNIHINSILKIIYKTNPELQSYKRIGGKRKEYNKEQVLSIINGHKGTNELLYKKICESENVGRNKAIDMIKEVTE